MLATALRFSFFGLLATKCLAAVPAPAPINASNQIQIISAVPPELAVPSHDTVPTNLLAWTTKRQIRQAAPGETNVHFTFGLSNVSRAELVVFTTATSCGCTVAKLPAEPWKLAPGAAGKIEVTMDLRGKQGRVSKEVTVFTSKGNSVLRVEAVAPDSAAPTMDDRARNQALATADRQNVFHGNCARCHAEPARDKTGRELYDAVCAICHDSPRRAAMVSDLHTLKEPTDLKFWTTWIAEGRAGTLMPAFARARGGPLTSSQIESLANYLDQNFRRAAKGIK